MVINARLGFRGPLGPISTTGDPCRRPKKKLWKEAPKIGPSRTTAQYDCFMVPYRPHESGPDSLVLQYWARATYDGAL
jgi:hypothetical protein